MIINQFDDSVSRETMRKELKQALATGGYNARDIDPIADLLIDVGVAFTAWLNKQLSNNVSVATIGVAIANLTSSIVMTTGTAIPDHEARADFLSDLTSLVYASVRNIANKTVGLNTNAPVGVRVN